MFQPREKQVEESYCLLWDDNTRHTPGLFIPSVFAPGRRRERKLSRDQEVGEIPRDTSLACLLFESINLFQDLACGAPQYHAYCNPASPCEFRPPPPPCLLACRLSLDTLLVSSSTAVNCAQHTLAPMPPESTSDACAPSEEEVPLLKGVDVGGPRKTSTLGAIHIKDVVKVRQNHHEEGNMRSTCTTALITAVL